MASYRLLFNPLSSSGHGHELTEKLATKLTGNTVTFTDTTTIDDLDGFLADLPPEERLIITGGDGTLNRFVNRIHNLKLDRQIYYYAAGTGNDFLRDVEESADEPFLLNPYFEQLPEAVVQGQRYRFLNGVGTGLDGFACVKVDERYRKTGKKGSYAANALKGLLYAFHPVKAVVKVDGVSNIYHHVWLAPTMQGRYFGGGIPMAPQQDRCNPDRTVSAMVLTSKSRFKTLILFAAALKGKHLKYTKEVKVIRGHRISVKFDRPVDMQIDGDTLPGVTGYTVRSAVAIAEDEAREVTV